MNHLKSNKNNIVTELIEYLFVIILVLDCNSMWTSYVDSRFNSILKISMVIVTVAYIIVNNKLSVREMNSIIITASVAVTYFAIYSVFVSYNILQFLYLVIDVLCIYIFVMSSEKLRMMQIFNKYINVVIIIAVVSLVFWLMGSMLGIIHSTGYVISTWTGVVGGTRTFPTYYNLYFETGSYFGIVRNSSIFTEVPMWNFHLCMALLMELFLMEKEVSKKKCAVLIITILTSISTTGMCLLVMALFLKYLFNGSKKSTTQIIRVAILPVILIAAIIILQTLVINKLSTSSGTVRLDDFVAGFKAWMDAPFFGRGYKNNYYVRQYMSSFRSNNQGFSNSPMRILYQGGLFLAAPYVFAIWKWIQLCIKSKNVQWAAFFLCFLFLFTFTVTNDKFQPIFILMSYHYLQYQYRNTDSLQEDRYSLKKYRATTS